MRKPFGVERGSFLSNPIPEVKVMCGQYSAVSAYRTKFFLYHQRYLNISRYLILGLTWPALVILDVEAGLNLGSSGSTNIASPVGSSPLFD